MKKELLIFLSFHILILSCKQEKKSSYQIKDQDKTTVIRGELILQGSPDQFFLNIEVMKDFFLVSDHSNDTVMYIYKNDNITTPFTSYLRKEKGGDFINPEFAKSDVPEKMSVDRCVLIDDRKFIWELSSDDQHKEIYVVSRPLRDELIFGSYYNFTSTDIYAVPGNGNANALFYMFANHKYYWVRPPLLKNRKMSVDNLYLNSLCVNEENNAVVCGMRFINQVLFYDLDAALKTTITLGDSLHFPAIKKGPAVDIPISTNYIIDIYGTPEYVYCLYDGTKDFKGISDIYVFSWSGKHIRTLKTGQNLKRIAVDKDNAYMLAIAENENGWRDVVKFSLKRKL